MSEPSAPSWLAWLAMLPLMTLVGAVVKKLFTNAVRNEMSEMHQENQLRLLALEHRFNDLEVMLGWIKGRMQAHWDDREQG